MDSVVGERHEVLLIDGVPDPQLGGDAPVEEVLDGEPSARSGVAVRPRSSWGRRWSSSSR